jgi:hypothetical protein
VGLGVGSDVGLGVGATPQVLPVRSHSVVMEQSARERSVQERGTTFTSLTIPCSMQVSCALLPKALPMLSSHSPVPTLPGMSGRDGSLLEKKPRLVEPTAFVSTRFHPHSFPDSAPHGLKTR